MSIVPKIVVSGAAVVLAWISLVPAAGDSSAAYGQSVAQPHVVLIGGLGGDPAYTDKFARYLRETRTHLERRFEVDSDRIIVLAEEKIAREPFVDGVSTAEEIRSTFGRISMEINDDEQLFVILFGHGSFDGTTAKLNIPREDLGDSDFMALLSEIDASRIVFINTASASGPFADVLSGPERVIVAATASGTERDETRFAEHLVQALGSLQADLDKDGRTSVGELVTYASRSTARTFEESGQLATEHAVLDDNGDGTPVRIDQLEGADDGHLAFATFIRGQSLLAADPAQLPLLRERQSIEAQIAEVKGRKSQMQVDVYYDQLKDLFVQLARVNDRIEGQTGASSR